MSTQSPKNEERESQLKGITRITVRGYKALWEERSIEICPLTILAGANSSGKSSIMQPLLMLKQTLDETYDPGALLLDGPHVRFTSADQFLSNLLGQTPTDSFTIKLGCDGDQTLTLTFRKRRTRTIELVEMRYEVDSQAVAFQPRMTHEEIESVVPESVKHLRQQVSEAEEKLLEWGVYRNRCFFELGLYPKDSGEEGFYRFSGITPATLLFEPHIRRIIHVPALRGNPERTYKTTAISDRFPGTFENYVASFVDHWQTSKSPNLKRLGDTLEALGLTWKVEKRRVADTRVEIRVGRLPHSIRGGAKDVVNIADVGFGVSQSLPVLVALIVAEPGQLVYLEQPEIHLHPRAQVALAQALANAANRGVRVVVETHSALLLLAIQSLVAEGTLSPELARLHWFERRGVDGVTEVTSAALDEAGAFGDWPEDFTDVELNLQSRYLDASEVRMGSY
jgi:hypothetical protein